MAENAESAETVKPRYVVESSATIDDLEMRVNRRLAEGYELWSSMSAVWCNRRSTIMLYQPMLLTEYLPNDDSWTFSLGKSLTAIPRQ